jgi:hypothetical protein
MTNIILWDSWTGQEMTVEKTIHPLCDWAVLGYWCKPLIPIAREIGVTIAFNKFCRIRLEFESEVACLLQVAN